MIEFNRYSVALAMAKELNQSVCTMILDKKKLDIFADKELYIAIEDRFYQLIAEWFKN